MIVVLRTLSENFSEKSDAVPPPARPPAIDHSSDCVSNKESQGSGTTGPPSSKEPFSCLCTCSYSYVYIMYIVQLKPKIQYTF